MSYPPADLVEALVPSLLEVLVSENEELLPGSSDVVAHPDGVVGVVGLLSSELHWGGEDQEGGRDPRATWVAPSLQLLMLVSVR